MARASARPENGRELAREVIQNSWDAALEAQKEFDRRHGSGGGAGTDEPYQPGFEIHFRFLALQAERKKDLVEALALDELATRKRECEARSEGTDGPRKELGPLPDSCLDHLSDDSMPLKLLQITETGTTGMYGPWGKDSRMYLAMASVGYTPKKEGGGSFGYGKAGMIRGSATRTVIAYSCFRERGDDPGVTRRLLGMTYWGEHETGQGQYVGFGRYGETNDDGRGVVPFENEQADTVADFLGISRRTPDDPEDHGTTFLVVDPVVVPDDLCRAVERNWWPALEDSRLDFGVSIESASGRQLVPRPKRDPVLRSFIRAYDVATVTQDNPQAEETRYSLRKPGKGRLGLVADLDGWSYPESTGDAGIPGGDCSLVALMRKPRMVVEYHVVGRAITRPVIRGVFVADDSIDEALRDAEPKGHDRWETEAADTVEESSAEIAKSVLRKIRDRVADFRNKLKRPPRPREKIVLPVFDQLLRQLLRGQGGGPVRPPVGERQVTISVTPMAEAVSRDQVRVSGQAEFRLRDNFDGEECRARIRLRYILEEDGTAGSDVKLLIKPPPGLDPGDREGVYVGLLRKGTSVTFDFESEPHSALWTGRFTAIADLIDDAR